MNMKKKCKLIIQDEVNINFKNLDGETRRILRNSLKVFNPRAHHTPTYKLGRWDGYTYYFSIGGASYFYLLDRILPIIQKRGYDIEIEDRRKKYDFSFEKIDESFIDSLDIRWPKGHEYEGEKIKLRDYQIEAINDFLQNLQGVKEIPTGAGKTLITALLSKVIEKYGKTITIVPSKNLVLQTERDFKMLGLNVGVLYGDRKNIDCKHIIATWQTLESLQKKSKNLKLKENILKVLADELIAVIVDECHTIRANVLRSILTGPFSSIPLRFGITATIPKNPHEFLPILCSLGNVINRIEIKELQSKGVLSNCKINIIRTDEKFSPGVDYRSEIEFLVTDEKRLKKISELIEEISNKGNTLVLVERIRTGETLNNILKNSVFISGSTPAEERKFHYEDFSSKNNKLLIATYGVASLGINLPRIYNLVMLEPGKSFIKVIQSVGRGMRKAKDKNFVEIYDICSNLKYSKKHLEERKKYYRDSGFPFEEKTLKY